MNCAFRACKAFDVGSHRFVIEHAMCVRLLFLLLIVDCRAAVRGACSEI